MIERAEGHRWQCSEDSVYGCRSRTLAGRPHAQTLEGHIRVQRQSPVCAPKYLVLPAA